MIFLKFQERNKKDIFYNPSDIPKSSNYYICNSLKSKIKFLPFNGVYIFLIPDFSIEINPKSLHLNFKEIDWKIFEIVIKKLSFSNANFSLSDTFGKVNFELKSEHNHQNKDLNCFVIMKMENNFIKMLNIFSLKYEKNTYKVYRIKLIIKSKININCEIYMTKTIINKDPLMDMKKEGLMNGNIIIKEVKWKYLDYKERVRII